MRSGRIIREAADIPLLVIQQPADAFFGACLSTSGLSLLGIGEVWRNRLPTKRKTDCSTGSRSILKRTGATA